MLKNRFQNKKQCKNIIVYHHFNEIMKHLPYVNGLC
jgi:hypothetical protein